MGKGSDRQRQIYEFILDYRARTGYPPSVREIADAVGLKSPSTVQFHLDEMERAGLLSRGGGKTRAISLPEDASRAAELRDKVPIVGNVAAGAPILAEELVEDYLTFDTEGLSGEHFALRVRGDSMIGAGILEGDLVVVRQQQTARPGEIVVALLGDEATVKRFWRQNGEIRLLPENDAYEPIDGREASLLGKVVAVVRRY